MTLKTGHSQNHRKKAKTPSSLRNTLPRVKAMIFALDKLVPGTANFDNLLYGTEVKFYNSKIELDEHLESEQKGLLSHSRPLPTWPTPSSGTRQMPMAKGSMDSLMLLVCFSFNPLLILGFRHALN